MIHRYIASWIVVRLSLAIRVNHGLCYYVWPYVIIIALLERDTLNTTMLRPILCSMHIAPRLCPETYETNRIFIRNIILYSLLFQSFQNFVRIQNVDKSELGYYGGSNEAADHCPFLKVSVISNWLLWGQTCHPLLPF